MICHIALGSYYKFRTFFSFFLIDIYGLLSGLLLLWLQTDFLIYSLLITIVLVGYARPRTSTSNSSIYLSYKDQILVLVVKVSYSIKVG